MRQKREYHVEIFNSNGNQIDSINYMYTSANNFKYFQLTRENSHLKKCLHELEDACEIKVYEKWDYDNRHSFIHTQIVKELAQ